MSITSPVLDDLDLVKLRLGVIRGGDVAREGKRSASARADFTFARPLALLSIPAVLRTSVPIFPLPAYLTGGG
jgi:hypothetical protein